MVGGHGQTAPGHQLQRGSRSDTAKALAAVQPSIALHQRTQPRVRGLGGPVGDLALWRTPDSELRGFGGEPPGNFCCQDNEVGRAYHH